jgi:hypothetical protein
MPLRFAAIAIVVALATSAGAPDPAVGRSVVPAEPAPARPAAPPACRDAAIGLTGDYAYALGSAAYADPDGDAEAGSSFGWLLDGVPGAYRAGGGAAGASSGALPGPYGPNSALGPARPALPGGIPCQPALPRASSPF